MEVWIDGGLLQKAREGDKESVRELCELTGKHLRELAYRCKTGNNDLIRYVSEVLCAIVDGQTPDEAFQWKRSKAGRPPKYEELLEWTLACHVSDLTTKDLSRDEAPNLSREEAIRVVGKAANMDGSPSGTVSKIYDKWRDRDSMHTPENIYPISKKTHNKIKEIDACIAIEIAQFKADTPQK